MTICVKCKHCRDVGYSYKCFVDSYTHVNPITGHKYDVSTEFCSEKNEGNCPDYKPKLLTTIIEYLRW
jgi:hypothetical protein